MYKALASIFTVGILPAYRGIRKLWHARAERIKAEHERLEQTSKALLAQLEQINGGNAGNEALAAFAKLEKHHKDLRETLDKMGGDLEGVTNELHNLRVDVRVLRKEVDRAHAMTNALLAMSDRAFWISEPDGSFRTASPRLARMLEVVPDALLGWGWVGTISQADREPVRQELVRACQQRRQWHQLFVVDRAESGPLAVEGNSFPVQPGEESGEIIGHIGWLTPQLQR
jgi:PAS domain-containing protein